MPFEALSETLLRAGIAPRHVRRCLRELGDHLADLSEAQQTLLLGLMLLSTRPGRPIAHADRPR